MILDEVLYLGTPSHALFSVSICALIQYSDTNYCIVTVLIYNNRYACIYDRYNTLCYIKHVYIQKM